MRTHVKHKQNRINSQKKQCKYRNGRKNFLADCSNFICFISKQRKRNHNNRYIKSACTRLLYSSSNTCLNVAHFAGLVKYEICHLLHNVCKRDFTLMRSNIPYMCSHIFRLSTHVSASWNANAKCCGIDYTNKEERKIQISFAFKYN